jgi:uncharacterized C2H2 Zn-finger protein
MGLYDTILLSCPKCGEIYAAQSKSGDCYLNVYNFDETPESVMENVNRHAPFTCEKCGTMFKVTFNPKPAIVETTEENTDFSGFTLTSDMTPEAFKQAFENYIDKVDKK